MKKNTYIRQNMLENIIAGVILQLWILDWLIDRFNIENRIMNRTKTPKKNKNKKWASLAPSKKHMNKIRNAKEKKISSEKLNDTGKKFEYQCQQVNKNIYTMCKQKIHLKRCFWERKKSTSVGPKAHYLVSVWEQLI